MDSTTLPAVNAALTLLGEKQITLTDPASRDIRAAVDALLENAIITLSRDTQVLRPLEWFAVTDPLQVTRDGYFIQGAQQIVELGGSPTLAGVTPPPGFGSLYPVPVRPKGVTAGDVDRPVCVIAVKDPSGCFVPSWQYVHDGYIALPDGSRDDIHLGVVPDDFPMLCGRPSAPFFRLLAYRIAADIAPRLTSGESKAMAMIQLYEMELRRCRQAEMRRNGNGMAGYHGSNPLDPSEPPTYPSWLSSR